MCGIFGLIDHEDPNQARRKTEILVESMRHRGPDGSGFWSEPGVALGMRRLSVIDLEHGWQPLFGGEREVVAFQNGEIYNYRDLRPLLEKEGYEFQTQSDTEVLAHGYHHWGIEGLLQRIDGMFAIAILDRRSRRLHLARDRFGEKPLFYAFRGKRFAFGSYMTALAALDWVDLDVDPIALDQYLAVHFVAGERTLFQGIRRVLPGEYLEICLDEPRPSRVTYYQASPLPAKEITDQGLMNRIEDAVRTRLVADVPVGVFLSGGLDSAIVASIAAKNVPDIATFSMGFPQKDYDESEHAAAVANAIGSRHHHFLFEENCFMDLLPRVAEALDEPVGDQAMLPVFWLSREARKRVTVVLAGEGADEVFAGYDYYRDFAPKRLPRLRNWLAGAAPANGFQRFIHNPAPQTPSGFPLLADAADRERMMITPVTGASEWEKRLMKRLNLFSDPLQRATMADIHTWLPDDLLVKFDRMAMAHSLEGRAPFLDPRVVEAGISLSAQERMTQKPGTSKIALRRVARNWLPDTILKRKKQGFCLPMASWLWTWFQEHQGVQNYFKQRTVPGLDMAHVAAMVDEDLFQGVKRERLLFALLLLAEWHDAFSRNRASLSQNLVSRAGVPD